MATPPPTETPAPLRSLTADEIASIERRLEYENIGKAWVRGLLATISNLRARNEALVKELGAPPPPIPMPPRAGEVLGTVVRLLPRDKEFTVAQVKARVAAVGVKATEKEVYNALGYLHRRKYLRRIGYGQYLVAVGTGTIVVLDDNDVPGFRNER